MSAYILKRILLFFPTLLAISVIVFVMIRVIPGDPALALVRDDGGSGSRGAYEELRQRLGLDLSYVEAYWLWISGAVQGDLGQSMRTNEAVSEQFRNRLPLTMEITLFSLVTAVGVGIPAGILAAVRAGRLTDYAIRFPTVLFMAIPTFWLALLVLIIPFQLFGYYPPLNYLDFHIDPVSNLRSVLPAALIIGVSSSAVIIRMTRTSLLEVLSEDYVRTAHAKGLRGRTVITRHVMKNALIPTLEIIMGRLPALLGGVVLLETVFALPGLGRATVDAVTWRDYTALQSLVVFNAGLVLVVNLLSDVLYAWLDPRVRYGQ